MNTPLLKKIVLFILLLTSIRDSFAQTHLLSKDARVSVITCGTGNESYALFGHTAIRISDPYNNIDVVYNYGAFDFDTPNFVLKFTKGDLNYFAVAHSYTDFINQYTYEKRSVFEQELNIPLELKQKLFDNLNHALNSEERYYTYKFIDKNCTSMVVDILNKTLGDTIIEKKADTDKTYRTILYPYFDNHFYEQLGTGILFGKKVDEFGTKIFLPFELQKSLKLTRFQNQSICKDNKTILEFTKETPFSWWNNCYSYLLLLGLILVLNNKKVDLIYLFTIALFGLFFSFTALYSLHKELAWNYNILLFNPTLFILLYFYFKNNKKWIYNLAVIHLIGLGIYVMLLVNKAHWLIVLPLVITNAVILTKMALKTKPSKQITVN